MKKLHTPLLLLAALFLFSRLSAQISLTTPDGTYSQNFDGMGTGTTLPTGWVAIRYGGSGAANAALIPGITDGSANSGNVYNVGKAGSTDRALGTLASGSTVPAFGASFRNTTGSVLGNVSFSAFSEQWRTGTSSAQDERVLFEYSTDATSLSTGTWTPLSSLDLVELQTTTTVSATVDGDVSRVAISGTITALNLADGGTFWIRWRDFDNTGSDGLYALDDLTMSWTNIAVAKTASIAATQNAAEPATNGLFTVTLNTPAPAGGLTVTYSLSGSATAGVDYTHPQNGTLTFAEGATTATIDIVVSDDAAIEPTETILATLTSVNGGYSIATGSAQITLADNESTSAYAFDFATCSGSLSDGFVQQSVTGAESWSCTNFGRTGNAVQMNGFATTARENEDWLISPALDLSGTTFPLLSFYSRAAFAGAPLQLFITTNYTGDVTTTAWTELPGAFPEPGSDVWTLSENIDLSAYKLANVRLAFKYTSTTAGATRWTLDDMTIINSLVAPPPALTLKNGILDFRQIGATDISTGRAFSFSISNAAGPLTITAPDNFLLSKNGFTYSKSISYATGELAAGQKTAYAAFRPALANSTYSGLLSFVSTGINVQRILLKGNTHPLSATLNVVNWNMEWFGGAQAPTDDDLQEENARKVLNTINADVYALEEVVDTARLGRLVRSLDSSYAYVVSEYGSLAPNASSPGYASAQKLALVYKTSVVSNVTARGLMQSSANANSSWASGRVPFLVNTLVKKNGASKNISFIVVHGKAGDAQSDYQSRLAGAKELKDTLDAYFSQKNVIILGDFNDDLDASIYTGGGKVVSSYDPLIRDSVDADHYTSLTLLLSQYNMNSTVAFSDVIDHVVVSNEMADAYLPLSASLFNDIALLADIADYGNTTSDHYPVLTRYFITGNAEAPLPVKLTDFNATRQNQTVALAWTTALELNSREFVVERSANGFTYAAIGTVAAAGNSSSPQTYHLTDAHPLAGANYYRLQSVDMDGKTETSRVVRVDFGSSVLFTLSPNPARNQFTITSNGNRSQLQLVDMSGKVVMSKQLAQAVETLPVSNLPKGLYLVQVMANGRLLFNDKLVIE